MAQESERNKMPVDAMRGKRNYSTYSKSISPSTRLFPRAIAGNPAPTGAITLFS